MILLTLKEMKKLILTSIAALLAVIGTTVIAQEYPEEYLGLPGDNLNLYAVMKLFQESETLEGFERNLNDENSRINNLDLNGDNFIDYITVTDYVDGDVHTIVLRTALSRNESQDVAVFTVQRFRDGSAQIQLIGDEALYGRNYIIEPIYDETPNPGYIGRPRTRTTVTVIRTTPYEIAAWPLVRFIFLPNYVVWRSSWYWGYYPSYWHPWRPFYWHYYYGYHYHWYTHYYSHYHHWQQPRYIRYNDFYYNGIRSHSPVVSTRIKEGGYRTTYSRPEQRREGEALYTRLYPEQNRRTSNNTAVSRDRRSVPDATRERTSAGASSGVPGRSDNKAADRAGKNPSSGQNANATRRTPASAPERASSRPEPVRNANGQRSIPAAASDRAASRPEPAQNANNQRRTPASASGRAASRPEPAQRAETARRSSQSAPAASSSRSRNSKESSQSTPSKKSEKAKESETSKPTRR
jgi:hypothetical protein